MSEICGRTVVVDGEKRICRLLAHHEGRHTDGIWTWIISDETVKEVALVSSANRSNRAKEVSEVNQALRDTASLADQVAVLDRQVREAFVLATDISKVRQAAIEYLTYTIENLRTEVTSLTRQLDAWSIWENAICGDGSRGKTAVEYVRKLEDENKALRAKLEALEAGR